MLATKLDPRKLHRYCPERGGGERKLLISAPKAPTVELTSPPASPSATIRRGVRSMRCWSWRRTHPGIRLEIALVACKLGLLDRYTSTELQAADSPQPSCRMAATHCIAALLMCS